MNAINVNAIKYLKKFCINDVVPFDCPICKRSCLIIDRQSLNKVETESSKKLRKYVEFEPEWIEYSYSVVYRCANPHCSEIVQSVGNGGEEQFYSYDEYDQPEDAYYESFFVPKLFLPAINYFNIPETTPDKVKGLVLNAFELTPISPSSAVNKIRAAIEAILTLNGINGKDDQGKFVTLNERIKSIIESHPLHPIKSKMLAIKWLGNAGSHEDDDIELEDLFDSFEILETMLNVLYNHNPRINKLVDSVIQHRGPISRRTRRSIN